MVKAIITGVEVLQMVLLLTLLQFVKAIPTDAEGLSDGLSHFLKAVISDVEVLRDLLPHYVP